MNNNESCHKTSINWYPGHMEKTKRLLLNEYKNIDLVYELVDARIPRSSKIKNIYEIIGNKPKLLIMTKKDLADPVGCEKWANYYEFLGTKVVVADLHNSDDIERIVNTTHEMVGGLQEKRLLKGMKRKTVKVLVIGSPNVGKSTLINQLVGKRVTQVENRPGVTKNLTWLKTKHDILLLDTPGLLWPKMENKEVALNLAALFSIRTEVVDVNEVAIHIINKLNVYYPEKLKERYGIDQNINNLDMENVYETIGKSIGAMRHKEVDYERVSNRIINDIKDGYIKGILFDNEM